ncbi:FliH/SctL family protein [Caballeronia telluris]|uniref:Flagellar assembly protein H n=1 Tax=Caballeronia telluris TaxID=326475 RepID=A0A158ET75_9BURK|nr:hypothetical protein [Caballeronia telluris]SAL10673.1 flagellar assembly protein H [Caballeronia telluris]
MTTLIKARSVQYRRNAHAAAKPHGDLGMSLMEQTPRDQTLTSQTSKQAISAPDGRDAELLALKSQLVQLTSTHAEFEHAAAAEAAAAYENGLAEGLAKGRELAVQDHERRDASLRSGVDAAVAAFHASLSALEPLAIDIAVVALERMLGDADEHAELITRTAAHHVAQLAAGSVLALEFATTDFPSSDDLARAAGPLARDHAVRVGVNTQLKAGQCLIRLNLGTLDASLDGQLARIRTALLEASS